MKIFKKAILVLILFLFLTGLIKNYIFDTPNKSLSRIKIRLDSFSQDTVKDNVLKLPKKIIYRMYYCSLVPIGQLTLTTSRDDGLLKFSIEATTKNSFLSKFLDARAKLESYFDKNGLFPVRYLEKTLVNDKEKVKELIFDRDAFVAKRDGVKIQIDTDTYDPLGAFFFMLSENISSNQELVVKSLSKNKIYDIKATLIKETDIFLQVLVDIKREDLTSSHGALFSMWITNDNVRIPVLFKSWTPVGFVTVVLEELIME